MKVAYAHRPLFHRMFNAMGNLAVKAGMAPSLDADRLLEKACRMTGLDDFGNEDFIEPLKLLTRSYQEEANLTPIGAISARTYLLQLLCNRLAIEQDRKQYPEITKQQVIRPVFITGLPRSGTTFLHGLMSQDPASRTPMSWEVMFPSPPPDAETFDHDRRIARCAGLLKWVDRLAPDFNKIHSVEASLPQECIAITTHEFASIQFHTTHHVPSYQAWLEQSDMTNAYHYHRRFLEQLQARHNTGRWVLKAPAHLFDLEALKCVYPDALVIQTHRDPLKVTASIASHANVIRAAFSDEIKPTEIADYWKSYWARALNRALNYRARQADDNMVDVYYTDLVRDPISVVKSIYNRLGFEFTEEFKSGLQSYIHRNPQGKHGVHKYSLKQFGLDPREVMSHFASYCQAHNIEPETG